MPTDPSRTDKETSTELASERISALSEISIRINTSAAETETYVAVVRQSAIKNQLLFDITPTELRVTVVNNILEWRASAGPYAHLEFALGVTLDNGDVVVKSPEYGNIDFDRFAKLIAHELNHSFWVHNFGKLGAGWTPNWVVEGLANFVASPRDLLAPDEILELSRQRKIGPESLEFQYRDLTGPEELVFLYSLWRAAIINLCPDGNTAGLMRCLRSYIQNPCEEHFQLAFAL